jgi:hypothetical protein
MDLEVALAHYNSILQSQGAVIENIPNHPDKLLESIVLCSLITNITIMTGGDLPKIIDLSKTNTMPYRAATRGSSEGVFVESSDLINWLTPIASVECSKESYVIFREGTPFHRSRERPDILLYKAKISHSERINALGEQLFTLSFGDETKFIEYSTTCDSSGPVERLQNGESPLPILGIEISLNKSTKRLEEQIDIMKSFGCQYTSSVILRGINDSSFGSNHLCLLSPSDVNELNSFINKVLVNCL